MIRKIHLPLEIPGYIRVKVSRLPYPSKQFDAGWLINEGLDDESSRFQKFNEALKLDRGNALALFNRGRAFLEANKYDRAIEDFRAAIARNPRNIQFYDICGIAYCYLHRLEDALVIYDSAAGLERPLPGQDTNEFRHFVRFESNRSVISRARQGELESIPKIQDQLPSLSDHIATLKKADGDKRDELELRRGLAYERKFELMIEFEEYFSTLEQLRDAADDIISVDQVGTSLLEKGISFTQIAALKKAVFEWHDAFINYRHRDRDLQRLNELAASEENLVFEQACAIVELGARAFWNGRAEHAKDLFKRMRAIVPGIEKSIPSLRS